MPTPPVLPIAKVALGIRFGPKWIVGDRIGDVADKIMRTEEFGPATFPNTTSDGNTRLFFNPASESSLTLTERDCILEMRPPNSEASELRVLAENFERIIVAAMVSGGMDDVGRFGMMIRLAECGRELTTRPTEFYLGGEPGPAARSIDLMFTRRLPTEAAYVRQDATDYRNLIYVIKEDDEGRVQFAIDYQEYFEPVMRRPLRSFVNFTDEGLRFFNNNFRDWIDRFRVRVAA